MIEFCITVNPDPKKSVSNRSYGALSSKKQYNILSYRLASAARRKAITDWIQKLALVLLTVVIGLRFHLTRKLIYSLQQVQMV